MASCVSSADSSGAPRHAVSGLMHLTQGFNRATLATAASRRRPARLISSARNLARRVRNRVISRRVASTTGGTHARLRLHHHWCRLRRLRARRQAHRNPSARVLLLEAGPVDGSMWIDISVGVTKLLNDPRRFATEPEPNLGG